MSAADDTATNSPGALDRMWALMRLSPLAAAVIALALTGLGISIYLTVEHYRGVAPVCTVGGAFDCAKVTSSAYSVLPGTSIPITIPGMLWFIVSGGFAVAMLWYPAREQREPSRLRLWFVLWAGAGLVFVLYLVYAEIVQLRTLCLWCTGVHVITLVIFLLALRLWQDGPPEIITRKVAKPATPRASVATPSAVSSATTAAAPATVSTAAPRSPAGQRPPRRKRRWPGPV
jgi:uncharacterized membrane protein